MSEATQPAQAKAPRARPNLVEGPIGPTLLAFSLPLMATNALQSLQLTLNAIWVSHMLGAQALTATVNSQILMQVLNPTVLGVGLTGSIIVAQAFGGGHMGQMKKVIGTCIFFIVVASLCVGGAMFIASPHILSAMNTPEGVRPQALLFLRATCISMPINFCFAFMTMLNRGVGDARTPFIFTMVSVVAGALFAPLLIGGWGPIPRFGIVGAVMSNILAQAVAIVSMYRYLASKKSAIILGAGDLHHLKPDWAVLHTMVTRGIPMGMQMFVMHGSNVVMLSFVNAFGVIYAAGYGATFQLWNYLQMPAIALGAAISSMAAQNIGAKRWDRVEKIALSGVIQGMAITAGVVALIYVLGDLPILLFLPQGGPALAAAHEINLYAMWSFIPLCATFVLFGVVRANGATVPPMLMLIGALWLIRIPFAHFAQPVLDRYAVWWAFPLGAFVSLAFAALYFKFGAWRSKQIFKFQSPAPAADSPAVTAPVDAPEPTAPASVTASAAVARATIAPAGDPIVALRGEIEAMQRRLNLAPSEAPH